MKKYTISDPWTLSKEEQVESSSFRQEIVAWNIEQFTVYQSNGSIFLKKLKPYHCSMFVDYYSSRLSLGDPLG